MNAWEVKEKTINQRKITVNNFYTNVLSTIDHCSSFASTSMEIDFRLDSFNLTVDEQKEIKDKLLAAGYDLISQQNPFKYVVSWENAKENKKGKLIKWKRKT